ncbi:hypothetical protein QRC94_004318 [Vibrio vulnificus]|nr:hypothetical protein [Vibrio vulnificus]EJC6821961.1 hypothetical protein [Vibrio vulnificus]EJC6955602.1 hypothetical protein [Vibrio vulnificus]EJC6960223.1 hypothetical protein [Vibrio vulnificus]EKQ3696558.1 hypothetical protein [Vibrio vulnificus]
MSLVSSANQDSEYLHYNTKASNFAGADEARFRLYLSTLCALYHASINLSLEKERFKTIEKSPEETFTSVIKSLGFSMETADIFAHKIEA